jgi:quercetin dioxygenase-like cupin family protein
MLWIHRCFGGERGMGIRAGEVLENPVTGERGIVRVAPCASNGYLLVADLYVRPGGAVVGEHVHPALVETFTVVRGRVGLRVDGRESVAGPGERSHVPAGVAHDWWNAEDSEAYVLVEVQPGGRFVQMIRQFFGLARDGKTDSHGRPGLLDGVALGREFADTMRFTVPPPWVQRVLFAILGPVARLTGHTGLSPRYQDREPEFAELEELPPDILAKIPALAVQPERPR